MTPSLTTNMNCWKLLPLCFVLFCSFQLSAQEKWSLEECLQYARENNISLQQSRLNIAGSEIDLDQSRSNRLPSVNGSASHVYNFGRSNDPTTNEFIEQRIQTNNFGVQGNMDLFRGFNLKHSIERDRYSLESSQLQHRVAENDLALVIVGAYLNILRSRDQIEVLKEQVSITNEQKVRVEKLIAAGTLPRGDILDLEAQVANNEVSIVQADNALELAKLSLAQTLDFFDELDIDDPTIDVPSTTLIEQMSVQEIYQNALQTMPEIQSAELSQKVAEKNLEISRSFRLPTLSLFGGMGSNFAGVGIPSAFELGEFQETPLGFLNGDFGSPVLRPDVIITETAVTPFFDQLGNNFNYNAGLALSVPIFNKHQVKNGIRRAELGRESAQLQRKQAENNLFQDIQQAYQDARAAAKIYESNLKTIEASEMAFNNAKKRYELGAATALEFSTARNNLAIAQLNVNSARYNYIFMLKILDFYQGKELKL